MKTHDDTELLDAIRRHEEASEAWDKIVKVNENDARIEPLAKLCTELSYTIAATPAFTRQGLAGKRRVIKQTGLAGDAGGNPPTGDIVDLVEAILELDAKRVRGRR